MNADWEKPDHHQGNYCATRDDKLAQKKNDHEAKDIRVQILLKVYNDSKWSKVISEKH